MERAHSKKLSAISLWKRTRLSRVEVIQKSIKPSSSASALYGIIRVTIRMNVSYA